MGWLDYLLFFAYLLSLPLAGVWFMRRQSSAEYFLGGKRQHWLAVALATTAAEVSAITFIAVPAEAFRADWHYLQMYVGALLGRLAILFILLPAFYGGAVTTVYEYLGQRFGPATRTTAASMFLVSRVIGSGLRLLAAAQGISLLFEIPLSLAVCAMTIVALAYTCLGGIRAVIWAEVVEAVVLIGAAVLAVVLLFCLIPGGWASNLSAALDAGKLQVFHFDNWHPNYEKAFWVLVVSATIQNIAALGTDQDLTQRLLTCPDVRRAQRSLLCNAIVGLPVVCTFLLIGTLLYVFYNSVVQGQGHLNSLGKTDEIFPHFIKSAIPQGFGFAGLLAAGVCAAAMSSLDSTLGALAATVVTDIYRPLIRPNAGDQHYVRAARVFTVGAAGLLVAVALIFSRYDQLLWEVFRWAGLVFGSLVGVFLLGATTTRRGADAQNACAMISSFVFLAALKVYQERNGVVYVAWPWWVVLGAGWTYIVGAAFPTYRPFSLGANAAERRAFAGGGDQ